MVDGALAKLFDPGFGGKSDFNIFNLKGHLHWWKHLQFVPLPHINLGHFQQYDTSWNFFYCCIAQS